MSVQLVNPMLLQLRLASKASILVLQTSLESDDRHVKFDSGSHNDAMLAGDHVQRH